jgi:predicted dinucleotide-utilizing enzyme
MQGLVTQLEIAANKEVKALKEISQAKRGEVSQAKITKIDDVARCLNLAVEAGADKASHEYYVATMLFRSSYNRLVFSNFDTNEQRMAWLQRATQQG